MALANQDRVLESSTTTGTGTYTLAGAVTGFQSFAAVGDANTVQYAAWEVDSNGNPSGGWETGLGTYTSSGTTLARTTIFASSNSGSAVSWSAGTRYIACSPVAEKVANLDAAQTFTAIQTINTAETTLYPNGNSGSTFTIAWDNGNMQSVTLSANCTFSFTNPAAPGRFSLIMAENGTGGYSITLPSMKWIGGAGAPAWTTTAGAINILTVIWDGTNYYGEGGYFA